MVIEQAPLEDELGDVLEKALCQTGLTPEALAERARVPAERIRDAIDYRYDFAPEELDRLASSLGLNPAGVLALAANRYPLPRISGLAFCLHPLRSPHGLGTANAYLVTDCRSGEGVLFDTGPDPARLRRMWPANVTKLAAIFLTHAETEHTGGLAEAQRLFGPAPVFAPVGSRFPGAAGLADGARMECAGYSIETLATPGHAEAHNAYLVRTPSAPHAAPLLISGDLLFAGSVGGGYFCCKRLREQVARVFRDVSPAAIIAPGHGPLTTLAHERAHNPFAPHGPGRSL
jgi:glyoxylase-like metal-dependent hydrolase (beta-lactamase superfamily II)/plasmid maintenance system antidote protein VapI